MEESNQNLIKIITQTKAHTIILDHHLVRDLKYQEKILPILESAQKLEKKIVTAAGFLGIPSEFLEAKRKDLYQADTVE
jgi:predicted metallo-beta-lactamase superfamily hydrolase